jgi:serine phosphatase RsbU (regulator of sigma subunit)
MMPLPNKRVQDANVHSDNPALIAPGMDLSNSHEFTGRSAHVPETGAQYRRDEESLFEALAEAKAGSAPSSGGDLGVLDLPDAKKMQQIFEIRAALEELAGCAAARVLKGNTASLRYALDGMRNAYQDRDPQSLVRHDIAFHRAVIKAAQNEVLLRTWDSLTLDSTLRGAIQRASGEVFELVESHQPIVDAFEDGLGREAGLLLRNHVEALVEFLKMSGSDYKARGRRYSDLETAEDVQRAFVAQADLSIPGLVCEAFYRPAHSIGGDYYDFLPVKSKRWGMTVGDVSGKGTGAALLMASLQASLRAQAMHAYSDISELVADVDQLVRAASPAHFYASLFYAEYDTASRTLCYVNAGHQSPLVLRCRPNQSELFHLEPNGTPLGLLEAPFFASTMFQLEGGDVLVMYTDGITDMENIEREMWGLERLESLIRACHGYTPAEMIRRILGELMVFAGGCPQRDDLTLVVVAVTE